MAHGRRVESLRTKSGDTGRKKPDSRLVIKRLLDVLLSGIALVLLAIPLLLIALAIRLDSKGPALFRQERMGKGAQPFMIWKFRTMKQDAEAETNHIYIGADNPNITRVGYWLRRWALDELPQLLNVFKGDMSLVGPRPTLRYQVERYDEEQKQRLLVKPGLTGWAQVNGRNKLNWSQRMEYDIGYVQNWSLRMDAKILLLTPMAVLRRDFAYADEVAQDDMVRPV
jgi:undecaprenyl phosphate N,N'-diacetylbacillosamine 1-phosphate transferase